MPDSIRAMLDQLPLSPPAVLARWPHDRPVVMLHSGRFDARWGRWSILAEPQRWERCASSETAHPLRELDWILQQKPSSSGQFPGGWIGYFSYELGRVIEPAARDAGTQEHRDEGVGVQHWPLYELAFCPGALIFDHIEKRWSIGGDEKSSSNLLSQLLGTRHPRKAFLGTTPAPVIGELRSAWSPDEHLDAVRRTIDYIRAGDIFQANITQRFTAPFAGSTRMLAAAAFDTSQPLYGAYLELPDDRVVLSMSPELFLQVSAEERGTRSVAGRDAGTQGRRDGVDEGVKCDAANTEPLRPFVPESIRPSSASTLGTRSSTLVPRHSITTRPIKGTRPASADPDELRNSEKDAAELHMIVDLMRNDLGRVCEYGSVRVPVPRAIESHPTVHHGVSEITGTLRAGTTIGEVLRAAFPGGSITGAPKIRAMQIIDELEPQPRGPYCGAIGWLGADGSATLNIAIRTMMLHGKRSPGRVDQMDGELIYGAGGGIVADSDPTAEYRESLDKTTVLRQVLESVKRQSAEKERHQGTEGFRDRVKATGT